MKTLDNGKEHPNWNMDNLLTGDVSINDAIPGTTDYHLTTMDDTTENDMYVKLFENYMNKFFYFRIILKAPMNVTSLKLTQDYTHVDNDFNLTYLILPMVK